MFDSHCEIRNYCTQETGKPYLVPDVSGRRSQKGIRTREDAYILFSSASGPEALNQKQLQTNHSNLRTTWSSGSLRAKSK